MNAPFVSPRCAPALAACAGASLLLVTGVGLAQSQKPLHIIVPYAPGGPSDILGRAAGQAITEATGESVVVDNRPGAAGDVGTALAAKAPPDGRTLNVVGISYAVAPSLKPHLAYDPHDFTPIAMLGAVNNVLVVHPSLPVTSVKALIALAKSKPGAVAFMSGGVGGGQHLAGELFNSMAGVKLSHVPYRGSAPAQVALLGGEVAVGFADMMISLPHIRSGAMRALAVTGPRRSPHLPDVPTIAEAALPGYAVELWFGLLAPAGTPTGIVTRVNRIVVAALARGGMRARLTALGADPGTYTPAEFGAFLDAEARKWAKVVKAAGIRAD